MHSAQNEVTSSYSKVVVEWPFRENGAERTDTALVKVGFCILKPVLKSFIRRNMRL